MEISFDSEKRNNTLGERGVDFGNAAKVFAGPTSTIADMRKSHGERWARSEVGVSFWSRHRVMERAASL